MHLDRLVVFAAVAESGSFTRAAERLRTTKTSVSRDVSRLEAQLGVRLLHRTTRRVVPTPAGAVLHQRLAPLLAALAQAIEVPERSDEPSGTLRVTTTADLASAVLGEVLALYAALYPTVEIEVAVTARVVDLVAEGFDAALRISGGPLPDTVALTARKVGTMAIELFASPRYLARAGVPQTLEELVDHDLIGVTTEFPGLPGRIRIRCDDMFTTRSIARAGGGIAVVPAFVVEAERASGALVRVVPSWIGWMGQVWLVTPHDPRPPQRIVAFRDLLLETLERTRALRPGT